jgi:hypothetical protein
MVGDLFINLAFEDFRKAGQDGYSSIAIWVSDDTDLGRYEREVEQTGNRGCDNGGG